MELFLISTEPGGMETLVDVMRKKNIPANRLRCRMLDPARPGFDTLKLMAQNVTMMGFESLAKQAPTERRNAQFIEVLSCLSDFQDDFTGARFGPVTNFDPSHHAVAVDSQSGLNIMAMDNTIGDKVTAHQGEWGVAMNMLEKLIHALTSNLKCLFVLTAHIEPERDEITGGIKLMTSTLGRKLAPKIPRFFSEVVLTKTEGANYFWSTNEPNIDLKHRTLPHLNKIKPDFSPIIEAYKSRVAYLQQGA